MIYVWVMGWLKIWDVDVYMIWLYINQGLVSVPFWVYWTSPYSSHYRPYT